MERVPPFKSRSENTFYIPLCHAEASYLPTGERGKTIKLPFCRVNGYSAGIN